MDHSKKRKSVKMNYLLRIVHNIVDCFCHEFFSEFIPVKSSPNPLRLPFDDVSRLIPYERHPNYGSGVVHRFLGAQETAVGDEHLHVLVSCEMNIARKFGMVKKNSETCQEQSASLYSETTTHFSYSKRFHCLGNNSVHFRWMHVVTENKRFHELQID